jgi:uncharacterized protein (TIGR01777 family)
MTENDRQRESTVLITGGSGMIGIHLTSLLVSKGYRVSHLSRTATESGNIKSFMWDPLKKTVPREAFVGVDYVIHLAGANLGEKRWTVNRKREIIESRIESVKLLHSTITDLGVAEIKAFITASASGFFGGRTSEKIFSENDPPAGDFQGTVCRKWEEIADLFENSGIRTVKIRSAVVLEKNEGALASLMKPAKFGFLFQTGSGKQYMPWIHINDLCNIYLKAIEDTSMAGVYHAAAPEHITHGDFVRTLGKVMKKPVFPIPAPEFILKIIFGEMSEIVLRGNRISSLKIRDAGYKFRFAHLKEALEDLIR